MSIRCLAAFLLLISPALAEDPAPAASPAPAAAAQGAEHTLPAIKASFQLPEGWFVREGTDNGVPVFQISREKLESDNDSFTAGLILSVTTKVPEKAEMKPSEYAAELLSATQDDADTPLKKAQEGPLTVMRTDYKIDAENGAINVANVAKANDTTGTLYFLTWQSPAAEEEKLAPLREALLSSFKFDPSY